ncbi:MAG TPA: hypothetical protein VD930_07075 [Gemmatimonadales bacterium]|nr:hypothetical protein [Gemmatimonadales bacterium]
MSRIFRLGALAMAAAITGCDRTPPTAGSDDPSPTSASVPEPGSATQRSAMDRMARRFARALADPAFRLHMKEQLDRSPFTERKLHLQNLLWAGERRVLKDVARLSATSEAVVEADARESIPLEIYFPVPAHRGQWSGGADVLVASAWEDGDAPVAYDVEGRRYVLSASEPPRVPVMAMVPVETDFGRAGLPVSEATCTTCEPAPPIPSPPPGGLYMTYSHFVQDFEGWFKGDPEFEIHILGQAGTSDSLRDYQCAGATAGGYYRFDQNKLDWWGSVLLFSQYQLNNYKTAHPNQNFRIVALEDDDTSCGIKFDDDRFRQLIGTLQAQYPNLTGAKDTVSGIIRWVKRANALQKILSAAYSFITTQDDLIGNAIEDVVAGQFYAGANWVIKGENNKTNGWLKLEMR